MAESFWSDYRVEPKRVFRWILRINSIPAWTIKKVKLPSFKQTEAEHAYINHTFFFPGRLKWDEVSFTLVDAVDPDSAATLMKIIENSGYVFPKKSTNTSTVSKSRAVLALGNVEIVQLGAGEGGLEEAEEISIWTLKNAWLRDVTQSELNYEEDGLVELDCVIRYDWAEQIKSGTPARVG